MKVYEFSGVKVSYTERISAYFQGVIISLVHLELV